MLAHITTSPIVGAEAPAVVAAFVIAGIGLALAIFVADRLGLLDQPAVPFGRWTGLIAAGLSIAAAAIHAAVIDVHLDEYLPFGVAFAALALFQVCWAVAFVIVPRHSVAVAGVIVNVAALVVWAVSRTIGLPLGPEPGLPEPLGSLDLAAVALETALVAVVVWSARRTSLRAWRPALPAQRAVIVLGSSALAIMFVTTGAFVVAGDDGHAGLGHVEAGTDDMSTTPPPVSVVPIVPVVLPTPGPSAKSVASPDLTAAQPAPPPTAALAPVAPAPTASATPARPTPAPPKPTPTPNRPAATPKPTQAPVPATPGTVRFGSSFDSSGEIAVPDHEFGEGDPAVWAATFSRPPGVASVRLEIVQVLDDGRQFEHWREAIGLADPSSNRLAGQAVLSIYVHGGEGSYRIRYFVDDELLAEGSFEMTP